MGKGHLHFDEMERIGEKMKPNKSRQQKAAIEVVVNKMGSLLSTSL